MIYYERVYVEVERKGEKSMWVDSTRSRGIDREHVLQYMQAKRKTLICGMAFLIFLFGTPLVAFIVGLIRGDRIEGPVLLGLFIAGELVVCFFLVRSLLRRYRALSPEDERTNLEEMDLFAVSEIKCGKNGVEIKFFDRLKALEKLEALTASRESDTAKELFTAIGQGASALREAEV